MMSIAKRVFLQGSVIVGLLMVSFFAAVPQGVADAASVSSNAHCTTLLVHLNGTAPATKTCLAWGTTVSPDTDVTGNCANASLVIYSYSNNYVCFEGHGYLGIRLDGVYQLTAYSATGWVRYYQGGPGNLWYYYAWQPSYGCQPFCGYGTEITQVDIY